MNTDAQENIYRVQDLSDLTQHSEHRGVKVPQVWIEALKSLPEVSVQYDAAEGPRSRDALQALIPRTTIVIRVRAALWEGLQASVKAFLAAKAASVLHVPEAMAQAASAIDSVIKLRKTVDRLDAKAGELCVYTTIVQARRYEQYVAGNGTLATDFVASHASYGRSCLTTTCRFHDGTACSINPEQREALIDRLLSRGIIERNHIAEGDTLWPT